jgi:hypothetical protein
LPRWPLGDGRHQGRSRRLLAPNPRRGERDSWRACRPRASRWDPAVMTLPGNAPSPLDLPLPSPRFFAQVVLSTPRPGAIRPLNPAHRKRRPSARSVLRTIAASVVPMFRTSTTVPYMVTAPRRGGEPHRPCASDACRPRCALACEGIVRVSHLIAALLHLASGGAFESAPPRPPPPRSSRPHARRGVVVCSGALVRRVFAFGCLWGL